MKCKWEEKEPGEFYFEDCEKSMYKHMFLDLPVQFFRFCPFCGHEIELTRYKDE